MMIDLEMTIKFGEEVRQIPEPKSDMHDSRLCFNAYCMLCKHESEILQILNRKYATAPIGIRLYDQAIPGINASVAYESPGMSVNALGEFAPIQDQEVDEILKPYIDKLDEARGSDENEYNASCTIAELERQAWLGEHMLSNIRRMIYWAKHPSGPEDNV